jgi:thymidylate synthase ThyX
MQVDKYFTNKHGNVFGLINLPEVIKGALFSRYSRSPHGLREILQKEFIQSDQSGFADIAIAEQDQSLAIQKAKAFYDRVLIGYGDDSVAELGGAHLACEGISNIAAKAIEDSRLGISFLEKSTRYVAFDQKINGQYLYYKEPTIMASAFRGIYVNTMDHLFDTYSELILPMTTFLSDYYPREEGVSDRAYGNTIRAKALDLLRGLLPMATLTNVGLFGNGRALEHLLIKLNGSGHRELIELSTSMEAELKQMIPSFVKRASSDHGYAYSHYLESTRNNTRKVAQAITQKHAIGERLVTLCNHDRDAIDRVVTGIIHDSSTDSWQSIYHQVRKLANDKKQEIIQTYLGDRASRHQKPGRAFEETSYTFDIFADIGAYRDLQRHRVLSQNHQPYTCHYDFDVPWEVSMAGVADRYAYALEDARTAFTVIAEELPNEAQYVVPFAYKMRWRMTINLRSLYHFVELRTCKQGHANYREIAQQLYWAVYRVHPMLVEGMKVDLATYDLSRLDSEIKIDERMS